MRTAFSGLAVFAVCIGSSLSADAAPPVRLAKPEVSARVLRVHRAMLQLLPFIVKGGGRHDSASSTNSVNCPGGGTLNATVNASTTGTSGSGNVTYSVSFTDCKTGDDTLGGSVAFNYTASASNGGATNTIAVSYQKANVVLKSVSMSPIVMQSMTISTIATTTNTSGGGASSPTTKNTASGNATVDGTSYTYSSDPLDTGYGS